jgi:methionine-rich copper-binding protein CopC
MSRMARVRHVAAVLVGVILVVSGAAFSGAPSALADDPELLVASDPYPHQELDAPPSGVVLAFSRSVDAQAAQIVVTNAAGKSVNINSLIVEGTNVTAQVKPNLPQGTYTVHYQINRQDGQVEGGAFQFSYGPGAWTSLPDEKWSGNTAQPTVLASPEVDTSTELPTPEQSPGPSGASSAPGPAGPSATTDWMWVVGAAVAVVLAVGGGVILALRRRRSGGGN